ncbi:hypothetical protein BDZ89DRAFT_1162889 [Hymenopellis radicata]|nr:hypothetical protein BDZ89DRAFT_1162889 [Hymenopellis radicata]
MTPTLPPKPLAEICLSVSDDIVAEDRLVELAAVPNRHHSNPSWRGIADGETHLGSKVVVELAAVPNCNSDVETKRITSLWRAIADGETHLGSNVRHLEVSYDNDILLVRDALKPESIKMRSDRLAHLLQALRNGRLPSLIEFSLSMDLAPAHAADVDSFKDVIDAAAQQSTINALNVTFDRGDYYYNVLWTALLGFRNLRRLHLYGEFTAEMVESFILLHPDLSRLSLYPSALGPRLHEVFDTLVDTAENDVHLTKLDVTEIGPVSEAFLDYLTAYEGLEELRISKACAIEHRLVERFWEDVLPHHEESLRVLSIILAVTVGALRQWCIDESHLAQLQKCKELRTINVAAKRVRRMQCAGEPSSTRFLSESGVGTDYD